MIGSNDVLRVSSSSSQIIALFSARFFGDRDAKIWKGFGKAEAFFEQRLQIRRHHDEHLNKNEGADHHSFTSLSWIFWEA